MAKDFHPLSRRRSEEEYFFHQDIELIRQRRAALDKARQERKAEQRKKKHWMHCPKCGETLTEEAQGMVVVDVCSSCGGLFLDKGELELILKMNEKERFIDHLAGWLDRVFLAGFDVKEGKQEEE